MGSKRVKRGKRGLKQGEGVIGTKGSAPLHLAVGGGKKTKKSKKAKTPKIDGLGPDDLKRIHKAVRQAWSWSHSWRLAKKRAMHPDGFPRCDNPKCEKKGKPVPKVFVDHVSPVGEVGGPHYIQKMFVPSAELQNLCKRCHDDKTNDERNLAKDFL